LSTTLVANTRQPPPPKDIYPTYLQKSKGFSAHQSTLATIVGNCGAIFGGTLAGYASQLLGRRFVMLLCLLLIGAFIPIWTLPHSFGALSAGCVSYTRRFPALHSKLTPPSVASAFLMQMAVQGAWGVVPILLSEMSPVAFRGTVPGVAYQLGNAISSSAAQIEATAGERWKTTLNGVVIDDYAKIMQVLLGVVAVWTFIVCLHRLAEHACVLGCS
jgi:SHS family lactate transporter-like MFS transporter